jgi:hypothetical protein
MSPFATGQEQMAAARPGVIEAAAPAAPPPPPPVANVAASPQVTGDPSTGLMPPSPQPSVAAAGVPQVGRVPGAAPGPWQEINNELAFKKNPTAADRITILTNELNRPGQTPENKRAIQYEIDAITKKNPGVIDQTRAEVNLMDPQQTSALPGAAKVSPPADPTVSTAVAPAQAKRILASKGGVLDNDQYEALRQKVLSKSAKATVTNTRSQELTVKRAEAAAITPSAVVEMSPAEAKQKLERLLPVLTAEQYRALRMRARG